MGTHANRFKQVKLVKEDFEKAAELAAAGTPAKGHLECDNGARCVLGNLVEAVRTRRRLSREFTRTANLYDVVDVLEKQLKMYAGAGVDLYARNDNFGGDENQGAVTNPFRADRLRKWQVRTLLELAKRAERLGRVARAPKLSVTDTTAGFFG
jgi:hypothetical protein